MSGHGMAFVILMVGSLGAIAGFFASTGRTLKKFDRLDSKVRGKLLLLEYYMAVIRNLSKDDLVLLSGLSDEAIRYFNKIGDYDERLRAIRKKIRP
jgi:hypothetical protein